MQSPLRYGSLTRRVNVAVWVLSQLGESGTRSSASIIVARLSQNLATTSLPLFRSGISATEQSCRQPERLSGIKLKLASRNGRNLIADRPLS